jgi:ubiquitin carboxyl-terminal hydrolase 5/13
MYLANHLANWGISVAEQLKTEKSMTELVSVWEIYVFLGAQTEKITQHQQQLEQNLKFDFSMTTEDGKQLPSLFGPGFTGLKNLGNR